ncbi:MAG: DNA gyrase subunit A [Patescibacteria group bacterium]|nr:DNA gyrase subunit A [Patescibacteria group bacterium]
MSQVQPTEITAEMKRAYLDYAMSVIVSRALPDVRDGLKPVHRRILYAMSRMGLDSTAKFAKSAKVVGEVLGKFHPHGDAPVYEALARLAQDFSMRYPLIKGQGNFGSIDGDPPAAMRYTEVKLAKISEEMLADIEKETVDWLDNFDGSLKEPACLPAKLPNLLLMGAEGIAVGMATKIPPHNLNEVVDALVLMIDNTKRDGSNSHQLLFDINVDRLLNCIKGPDLPTGAIIYGASDIRQAYLTGKGSIMVRAKVESEKLNNGKTAIIVKELPYQVNKADLVEKIAQLVNEKKIVGISDLRDESDREGVRIVIELKKDASYKQVLNNLFKHTELQTTFPVNMVALVDGVPQTLSLRSILEIYLRYRIQVVTRRTQFDLRQAKERAHILEGYLIALDHIDEIIELIKKAADEKEAKANLISRFKLSEIQAQAILDMQLKKLTGLERRKVEEELTTLKKTIDYLESLLQDVFKILQVIREELLDLKRKYGDERRTEIVASKPGEFSEEMLIENKEVIVVLTREGYIKQTPKELFRVQSRGGKGVSGIETKESDNVYLITTAMTHDYILYFSNVGRVFQTRVWEIPSGSRTSKGKPLINLISLKPQEKITSILIYNKEILARAKEFYVLMSTKLGNVKKTPFEEYLNIRSSGIVAIKLEETDELMWVKLTDGKKNVILVSAYGKAIVFREEEIKPTARASIGVKGITLETNNFVVAADVFSEEDFAKEILVIGERGIGKKTALANFKGQHRAGKGVKIAEVDEKIGQIAYASIIDPNDETLIITSAMGQIVKIPLRDIPSRSRTAKGVILMRFSNPQDKVVSATMV